MLPPPDKKVFTDIFLIVCGAPAGSLTASVVWFQAQSLLQFTCWNLRQCVWHCLSFQDLLSHRHVLLCMDNTTVAVTSIKGRDVVCDSILQDGILPVLWGRQHSLLGQAYFGETQHSCRCSEQARCHHSHGVDAPVGCPVHFCFLSFSLSYWLSLPG